MAETTTEKTPNRKAQNVCIAASAYAGAKKQGRPLDKPSARLLKAVSTLMGAMVLSAGPLKTK